MPTALTMRVATLACALLDTLETVLATVKVSRHYILFTRSITESICDNVTYITLSIS